VAAALDGDPDARATWDDLVAGVAAAARVLVQTLDVELVLLGGGVAAAEGSALLAEVRQRLTRSAAPSPYLASLELPGRVDLLRTDAPVAAIGAALLGSGEEVPWPR